MVIPDSLQTEYRALLAATQLHLVQEYSTDSWLDSSSEICDFFRARLQPRVAPPAVKPKPVVQAYRPAPAPIAKPVIKPSPAPKEVLQAPKPTQTNAPTTQAPITVTADDLNDWRKIISEVAPKLEILEAPESLSKSVSTEQATVMVLVCATAPLAHQLLLKDLAQALCLHSRPARLVVLNQQKAGELIQQLVKGPSLKLVIGGQHHVSHVTDTASFTLPDLNDLIANSEKKRDLWQAIVTS